MQKILFFILLVVVQCSRAFILKLDNKNGKFLLISFFMISVPFHFAFPIYNPAFLTPAGTLGTKLYITIPILLLGMVWFFLQFKRTAYQFKSNIWILMILFLAAVSLLNKEAPNKYFTFIFLLFFVSHILLFQLFLKSFSRDEIIKGVYDGFMILGTCQFLLAICFPLLNISLVTKLFHQVGEETATRKGSRPGALGFFVHPGRLALFTIISSAFFQACYLFNYKRKLSIALLVLGLGTVFLSYSRTALLVYIITMAFVYFIYKNANKPLITMGNVFKFVLPTCLALGWLVFLSPLSSSFLKSDSTAQLDNRMIHWRMALQIFSHSPLIGVGINSHLEYFSKHFSLFNSMIIDDEFFWQMPIHNIHLLILVETGLIGLVLWFVFGISTVLSAKKDLANNCN